MKLAHFLECYPPSNTTPAPKEMLLKYKDILPYGIIQIWHQHGFGKYGEGIIEIIDPEHYMDAMETWLGKRPSNYVPIAVTAFGELFYYRKLTMNDEDVCMIDPHYSQISTCCWSLDEFFNEWLCLDDIRDEILRSHLFQEACKKLGTLRTRQIYLFEPALPLGGSGELDSLGKGDCAVHLQLLFQLR